MVDKIVFEYHIEEAPLASSTESLEVICNKLGSEGWSLLFVGPYGSSASVRAWFMREKKDDTSKDPAPDTRAAGRK